MHDIACSAVLASLLEASAPKPGNVNRYRDFRETRYEHFLASSASFYKPAYEAARRGALVGKKKISYSDIGVGSFIREAVERAMRWQKGGNTNLGSALLLIPLCSAAGSMLFRENRIDVQKLGREAGEILSRTTYMDTLDIYEAIRAAKPSGLGKVKKYDAKDLNSIKMISDKKINLYEIMNMTENDNISLELTNEYKITLEGYRAISGYYSETGDINGAILKAFFSILAGHPDSLIARKVSIAKAREISSMAEEILRAGLTSGEVESFDRLLRERDNLYNPGTTADIVAASLFVSILGGLKV